GSYLILHSLLTITQMAKCLNALHSAPSSSALAHRSDFINTYPMAQARKTAGYKDPLAENRRARFDYDILEHIEAGVELTGMEAKSTKLGRMNLSGAYVIIRNGEAHLLN